MGRALAVAVRAVLVLTVLCGIAYPVAVTGVAQVAFGGRADGSLVTRDGVVVGSRLIGQDLEDEPRYFHGRPSQTGYDARASAFGNAGPNSPDLAAAVRERRRAYLRRNAPGNRGLRPADVPVDAVTTSASGLDPDISVADARIQAGRVAQTRGLPRDRVLALVEREAHGRALGILGEVGVTVLDLNLALDAGDVPR